MSALGCRGAIESGAAGPGGPGTGGNGFDPEVQCDSTGTIGAPVPVRRLTATQVERTALAVLGANAKLQVSDEKLATAFRSNVSSSLDATSARGYLNFAESVSASADMSACTPTGCLAWLLDEVAPGLFRRPLEADERTRYTALFEAGEDEGARWVIEALLQSPVFLYVDEVATEDGLLDDRTIATRLALVLWGQNPDATLIQKATNGELRSADAIAAEAERMLKDPRSDGGLHDFVDQWLELARIEDAEARPDLAALGKDVTDALRREPVAFVAEVLHGGGGIVELLRSTSSVRSDALADIYGDDILSTSEDRVELDPAHRSGVLTLPGVMAALAHANVTSPTVRGHTILGSVLCNPPPPPPAGLDVTLPEPTPGESTRQRLEKHFSDDTCGACHRSMDGVGFAFENFDWFGKYRTDDSGVPVESASDFMVNGQSFSVADAVDFTEALADNRLASKCVAKQWVRYATGIPENTSTACLVEQMATDLHSDEGLRTMMLTYVTSDWFRRASPEGSP
ncbi:MAG: DUF1592 domain-containing protein [Polyangiales bacterium]|nr:DUF1592 domain-containing protein [Myxococcales bacterium]